MAVAPQSRTRSPWPSCAGAAQLVLVIAQYEKVAALHYQ